MNVKMVVLITLAAAAMLGCQAAPDATTVEAPKFTPVTIDDDQFYSVAAPAVLALSYAMAIFDRTFMMIFSNYFTGNKLDSEEDRQRFEYHFKKSFTTFLRMTSPTGIETFEKNPGLETDFMNLISKAGEKVTNPMLDTIYSFQDLMDDVKESFHVTVNRGLFKRIPYILSGRLESSEICLVNTSVKKIHMLIAEILMTDCRYPSLYTSQEPKTTIVEHNSECLITLPKDKLRTIFDGAKKNFCSFMMNHTQFKYGAIEIQAALKDFIKKYFSTEMNEVKDFLRTLKVIAKSWLVNYPWLVNHPIAKYLM